MATGYKIEIGYLSDFSFSRGDEAAWNELKVIVTHFKKHHELIATEAANELHGASTPEMIKSFLAYSKLFSDEQDGTLKIYEKDQIMGNETPFIFLMASGSGGSRSMKEQTRRAFIRLVMREAHRKGIELNVFEG